MNAGMTPAALWHDICRIRQEAPLIHNVTNFVVMNNTANALLALGASPVMAHAPEEVTDMVTLSAALVLNIGTLDAHWINSMRAALLSARGRGVPVVLDPVGAGATPYRTAVARDLIKLGPPTVVRGNASELSSLAGKDGRTKGVDSSRSPDEAAAQLVSTDWGCVVCISGETDVITGAGGLCRVRNGHPAMRRVTGLGCTASALIAAFCAVNPDPFTAAAHGMCLIGICGEIAAARAKGPGSLQVEILDCLANLGEREVHEHAAMEAV